MLKKNISYTDYNGEAQNRDFYFNLSRAEIAKLELSIKGGIQQKLEKIIAEKDAEGIMNTMNDMIMLSYGEKSPDGRFIKSKELAKAFSETAAYDELFVEIMTDPDNAAAFISAIIPKIAELPKTN